MEDWRVAPWPPPAPKPAERGLSTAGFQANPGLMGLQADGLDTAADDLAATVRSLSMLPPGSVDIFGAGPAAEAYLSFFEHWVGETSIQTDALREVADKLRQCARNYCLLDGQVQHDPAAGNTGVPRALAPFPILAPG